MDNFNFLNKKELSFILNNESNFGKRLIDQVEDYCQRKKYSIKKIKAKTQEWKEDSKRLNFELENNEILISKTEVAKKDEFFKFNFLFLTIGFLFLASLWVVFTKGKDSEEFWVSLFLSPLGFFWLKYVFKKRKEVQVKNEQRRELKIFKSLNVHLFENGRILNKKEIKEIYLFWEDDGEAGSLPKVKLELKINDFIVILIDDEGNYLELLRCGNEISKFIDKKLNIFEGKSPIKGRIVL